MSGPLSGPGPESVAPVQPDEPGQGERVPPLQPGCGTLEQHHLLTAARSDWLYQAAADPELGCQRRGDLPERGRDQDGIVGGTLGQPAAAVASEHLRIADALPGQVLARLVRQVWPRSMLITLAARRASRAVWKPRPVPISSTWSPLARCRPWIIRADSEGCVVTCRCPIRMGSSR